jgi:ATP-binding cassette subfamily B protein
MNTKIIKKIYFLISKVDEKHKSKLRLRIFFIFLFATSISEMVSIYATFPFLAILLNPDILVNSESVKLISSLFDIRSLREMQITFTIIFILSVAIAGMMRIFFVRYSTNLSFKIGEEIGEMVFTSIIKRPYEYHVSTNSSETLNTIIVKVNELVYGLIFPSIVIVSAAVMIIIITTSLVIIDPTVAISTLVIFGLTYLIISIFTKTKLINNSHDMTYEYTKLAKLTQESLGSIKDIILGNTYDVYIAEFNNINSKLRRSQASNMYISQSPRIVIESLVFIIIAIFAIMVTKQQGELILLLPILGIMMIGAQKLLPLLHQIYASWSTINSNLKNVNDIVELLKYKKTVKTQTDKCKNDFFHDYFELRDITIQFDKSNTKIIDKLDLKILKGNRIGIIGESGSGKSSLLNVIMGLIHPKQGGIFVDGNKLQKQDLKDWSNIISYVPQSVYLTDGTILNNIAFGVKDVNIDKSKIISIAKELKLHSKIETLQNKYHSVAGENGIFFSGGERQRIAIARALYRESQIIIFDEPTSALDKYSEAVIMDLIYSLSKNLTIIIVSHNIETLKNCNHVYQLLDKKLCRVKLNETD